MQYQWIDLILIVMIGLSTITGLFRGVIKEVIALGIWIVAIWVGYNYSQSLTPWLSQFIANQTARTAAAFMIIVIGVMFAGAVINFILGLILRRSGLSSIDKILGGCFGFGRGVLMVSLVLAVLKMTSLPYQPYTQSSVICNQLQPVVNWISGYIPIVLNQMKSMDSVSGNIGNIIDSIPHP
ncbi:MAG: CvpA family protein [Legionella sp.]|uniref:CvpA family protein n=1 Tax=Legionella sp. TaxID=459 RepID=UPI00283C2643|nr:CvpA family protein [Legionella sp.]